MSRALCLTGVVAVCLSTALLSSSTAHAASATSPQAEISRVASHDGVLDLVFQATDLPAGATIDPGSVRVTVDGRRLAATARPFRSSDDQLGRTAVLAFDTSRSMSRRINAARDAAIAFLDDLPADVKVGLVTFDTSPHVVSVPTVDRAALGREIRRLTIAPATGTALYDGTLRAVALAGDEGSRSVLLLTDGRDFRSSTVSPAEALSTVTAARLAVDAVYIGSPPAPASLAALVAAGKGQVASSDTTRLTDLFHRAAEEIRSQIQISVPVPQRLAGASVNVRVSATAGGIALQDTAQGTFGAAASAADHGPRPAATGLAARLVPAQLLPVGLLLLFVGLLVLLAQALTSSGRGDRQQGRLRRRLSIYTLTGRAPGQPEPVTTTVLGRSPVARSAVELAGRVVQQRDFETTMAKRLDAAGVPLRPAEWTLIHLGCATGLGLFLLLVSGGAIVATLLGIFLGAVGPWIYLSFAESRRSSAFLAQLPDTLQLIAGSLSAGYSVPQALDTVVREGQQPMTGEFNRALVETRLGVPIDDALNGVATRMQSKDFSWVVMAYRIQRDVGGNLSELLGTLAETMRERERLRRQVRALSAEGRLSGWILGLLPPGFALYLVTVRPEYLRPLVTEPLGLLLLAVGGVLLAVGVLWMRKAVKVEV
ncbi:MAG: tight adherence protein [Actinomycetota bacterium]|jgi:tight adherence protein B|nr:tight adherence protein [Actinomycetota bacterium]